MRGRKPDPFDVSPRDLALLRRVAACRCVPWSRVQHARILLAMAGGGRVVDVAAGAGCDPATVWRVCRRYEREGLGAALADEPRSGRPPTLSPLQRAQIVRLACLEPVAEGLHITHWSTADLARQAVADGIVTSVSPRTVWQILHDVDLQPHRTRYWRTGRLDELFKERAEAVLWCYANAERLAGQGVWSVAVDEMPNLQVLEREPIRRALPGQRRAPGVRVHPPRHGQPAAVPGAAQRRDGAGGGGEEGRRPLRPTAARLPPPPPRPAGRVPDPGRRPRPHRRRHRRLLPLLRRLVAAPPHPRPRLLAQPGGDPRRRLPAPATCGGGAGRTASSSSST